MLVLKSLKTILYFGGATCFHVTHEHRKNLSLISDQQRQSTLTTASLPEFSLV